MNSTKITFLSAPVIIASLLSLAVVMTIIFSSVIVHAATLNIVTGENLTVGNENYSVSVLQQLLSETGYLTVPTGIAFGHFGPLTQSALARYQAAMHVAPAIGYFGPVTKVNMYADYNSRGWLPLLGWN